LDYDKIVSPHTFTSAKQFGISNFYHWTNFANFAYKPKTLIPDDKLFLILGYFVACHAVIFKAGLCIMRSAWASEGF